MAEVPKARILCTEDDEDTRDILKLLLETEGFEVTCAEASAEALSLAKAEKFDLYILDNWMPETSGYDLCQQIREFDSATPILFYSGVETDVDHKLAMSAGAQGYLIKPTDPDKLVAEIKRLIDLNSNSLI